MAQTKVVNPKRKMPPRRADGTFKKGGRRSNPKRRTYAHGAASSRRRRRRNPATTAIAPTQRAAVRSVYSYGGYRQKNPDMFDMDYLTETVPAATSGVLSARWGAKMAGDFEDVKTTVNNQPVTYKAPGLKHAVAIVVAAHIGSSVAESMFGAGKGAIAKIAALGYGGNLFVEKRFFRDNDWMRENLLSGVDDDEAEGAVGAFENKSTIGQDEPQLVQGPDGNVYQLGDFQQLSALGAFENRSAIGAVGNGYSGIRRDPAYLGTSSDNGNSFGYAHRR
jgi:hypothetical protein